MTVSRCMQIALYILLSLNAHAYVFSKTQYGENIWWAEGQIKNTLDTENSSNLTDAEVTLIYQQALSEWSPGDLGIQVSSQIGGVDSNTSGNRIYFDGSSSYFSGSGVVAVTQTSYRESTGEIVQADIIINDDINFSAISSDKMYLGNVLSHEFGHFFGMAHSEVKDATMFYSLGVEQWSIENDDLSGVKTLYSATTGRGTISGTIVGGSEHIGIFGAHVEAISAKSGAIVGSISAPNGSFSISGLDLDSTYYLAIKPLKALSTLPDYYSTVEKDFCDFGADYKLSFFQSCEARDKGHPTAITIDGSNAEINVGEVSIGCSLDVPTDYLSGSDVDFSDGDQIRGSFIGYVVAEANEDSVNIDLTDYTPSGTNEYLSLNVVGQGLFSMIMVTVQVYQNGIKIAEYSSEDGDYDLDISGKIALGGSSPGLFEIKIIADELVEYGDIFLSGKTSSDYFPEGSAYTESDHFYIFSYEIFEYQSGNYRILESISDIDDNGECVQGSNSYKVLANVIEIDSDGSDEQEIQAGVTCASIDTGGPTSGLSIMVGFLFAMLAFTAAPSGAYLKKTLE